VARWLTFAGLAIALVLLVAAGTVAWTELLFPAWILALSIDILVSRSRASAGGNPARPA
jgi:L-asparagine transporter-like permease